MKEADNGARIGEGWKKTTKALQEKRAMALRRAEKLKPSAFKSATLQDRDGAAKNLRLAE